MPSPQSLRRLANLTRKVRNDLRRGGMAVTFKYIFRSTAILARVVELLAESQAAQAEEEAARIAAGECPTCGADHSGKEAPARRRRQAAESPTDS